MGLISPQQQNQIKQLQNRPTQEQAQALADLCNSKGITKEDLQKIMSYFNK
jgi:hypothetical protein